MVAATVKNASQRKTLIVVMPFIDRVMQELQVQGLELQLERERQQPHPHQHYHQRVAFGLAAWLQYVHWIKPF